MQRALLRLQRQARSATVRLSKALVGRRIIRKWEGYGWLIGTITSVNELGTRKIAGDKVNFFVSYDGEDVPVPHVLESQEYKTEDDADYDSWLLLEEQGPQPEPENTEED